MNKLFIQIGLTATIFLSIVAVNQASSQTIHDNIAEDQVIVCINGSVIEQSGNICKVFMADLDHERSITDIQEDLYKNPNSDTFNMDVSD